MQYEKIVKKLISLCICAGDRFVGDKYFRDV